MFTSQMVSSPHVGGGKGGGINNEVGHVYIIVNTQTFEDQYHATHRLSQDYPENLDYK